MVEPPEPTSPPEDRIELLLPETASGRLDRALAALELGISRSNLQRWIEEGRVLLEGMPATRRSRARPGHRVEIFPAPPPPSEAIAQDLPLEILYEDEHLIALNKAAGVVVHPAPGHPDGTLVNALLFHAELRDGGDPMRPGIVHRIDKGTTGVMVVAKTVPAREGLVALFAEHRIERAYLAICLGRPPQRHTFTTLHGRHPTDRKRFSGRVRTGKRAVTHLERLEELHGASLLRCRLETGRTHQIRVHLKEAGHPLLGDPLYGRPPRDPLLREQAMALGRPALHAAVLGFVHPITAETLRFEVEPPADFRSALEALRAAAPTSPSMS